MGQYNFAQDLKEGHRAEDEVLKIIKNRYPEARRIEGYFKDFDIYVPEVNKKLEVKFDWAVRNTGNYFFEVEFNKKDEFGDIVPVSCGVEATKADYWVTVDHEVIIIIEIETLRYILRDYQVVTLPPKKTSLGGKGYLVKKDTLLSSPYVLIIDKLDSDVEITL